MTASRKTGETYIVRLDKGQEIIPSIKDFCIQNKIEAGIVSGIGVVENPTVGCFNLKKKEYDKKTFDGDFEITSLLGNISFFDDGNMYVHLHITMSDGTLNVRGGHLLDGKIGLTGEIFIKKLDTRLDRKHLEDLGLNVFNL